MSVSSYYKWFKINCNSVDFKTFSGVKSQILKYLKDDNCPGEIKLLFGTFLLKTIYMMCKFRGPDKENVVNCLIKPIEESKNVIQKGEYLKYHDTEATGLLSLNFYINRFKDRDAFFILQLLNDVQLVKGYLQRSDITEEELLEHFLSWVKRSPVNEQRSNILDVLLRYYPKDKRVVELHEEMKFGGSQRKDVYVDDQNVHDEEIWASVLNSAENLMKWGADHKIEEENPSAWAKGLLFHRFSDPKQRTIIECCLERCCIDTTTFGSGFTIADVFFTTLNYITLSPTSEDSYPIFMEEMDNMKELCSSGYVARCINALQGQDESGKFEIKISFSKKLHSLISMRISNEMERYSNENVILGTYDPNFRHYFLDYILSIVNAYIPFLIKENCLQDVEENICSVLKKITESEWVFNKENDTVEYKLIKTEENDTENLKDI